MGASRQALWKRLNLSCQYVIVIKKIFLAGTRDRTIYITDNTHTFKELTL